MTIYKLDYIQYLRKYSSYHASLEEALEEVRDLCSCSEAGFHSKGMPILLTASNGRTAGEDVLWNYGEAFEFNDNPEPFRIEILTALGEQGVNDDTETR